MPQFGAPPPMKMDPRLSPLARGTNRFSPLWSVKGGDEEGVEEEYCFCPEAMEA